jgi:hypothetical protein
MEHKEEVLTLQQQLQKQLEHYGDEYTSIGGAKLK